MKTFEEKQEHIRKTRHANYIASCRLEGIEIEPITSASPTFGMSKEEVIEYYNQKYKQKADNGSEENLSD